MKTAFKIIVLALLLNSCKPASDNKIQNTTTINPGNNYKIYSKSVRDTFTVFVSLPNEYDPKKPSTYPVIYLLDANLFFDMVSPVVKKYSEVGLLSPAIVVGIGYKDLVVMDSLRTRDYTYPIAIPEYEMAISGKADIFLSFISNELIPDIEKKYNTDKTNRVLMGHSLGAYFTLYALQQDLTNSKKLFSSYIAASPSTHYNHNYLLNEFGKLNVDNGSKTNVYITFGGLEDEEDDDTTLLKTSDILLSFDKLLREKNKLNYKGDTYTKLDHMDMPLPTFVKGLRWVLNKEQ